MVQFLTVGRSCPSALEPKNKVASGIVVGGRRERVEGHAGAMTLSPRDPVVEEIQGTGDTTPAPVSTGSRRYDSGVLGHAP